VEVGEGTAMGLGSGDCKAMSNSIIPSRDAANDLQVETRDSLGVPGHPPGSHKSLGGLHR
jgi:hypothetical protein